MIRDIRAATIAHISGDFRYRLSLSCARTPTSEVRKKFHRLNARGLGKISSFLPRYLSTVRHTEFGMNSSTPSDT